MTSLYTKITCHKIRFEQRGYTLESKSRWSPVELFIDRVRTSVFEDNQGAAQLSKNTVSNSNSKYIDVRHDFLRELVRQRDISAS